jgi:cytochrome P450
MILTHYVYHATQTGLQAVLDTRPGTFDRPKQLCDPIIHSGFGGVVAQHGEAWKRHRRVTSSAFR